MTEWCCTGCGFCTVAKSRATVGCSSNCASGTTHFRSLRSLKWVACSPPYGRLNPQRSGHLGRKIIKTWLPWSERVFFWHSLIPCIVIHLYNRSLTKTIKVNHRTPQSTSPEIFFLQIRELLQKLSTWSTFECFCNILRSLGSRVVGAMDMILIKSNFTEGPSMLFSNLLEDLFATFLHVRKVKYVVAAFGLEA